MYIRKNANRLENIMKRIITLIIILILSTTTISFASTSDYELAKEWANKNCKGATIEKVITISKGGTKGRVKGTKYTVKYPKKVKKGKKVTVYFIVKDNDIKRMVCLGKIK